jgi:cellulose synthase/poly-beta-1,6-N-acetylglucosamine synthase-like glycosyltransferase
MGTQENLALRRVCIVMPVCKEKKNVSKMPEGISIVIPTYNEEDNISDLIKRIHRSFLNSKTPFELIFIDDNSTDDTVDKMKKFDRSLRMRIITKDKHAKKGKAESLLIGFKNARYDSICMIDADLQYPPEEILLMHAQLKHCDIVVADRKIRSDSNQNREFASKIFRYFFGKLLFDFDCDVQSGLKVFKKEISDHIEIISTPWTFDLQFLHKARNLGYTIESFDIEFAERQSGKIKLDFFPSIFEIGSQALKLKLTPLLPVCYSDETQSEMMGNGISYKGNRFITHTDVNYHHSALQTVVLYQKIALTISLAMFIVGFVVNWRTTIILVVAMLTALYFLDLLFNLFLISRSIQKIPEIRISQKEMKDIKNKDLPVYTILCPLYRESNILPQFIEAISKMDWPKNRLEVQLLFEEDDEKTIEAAKNMNLPDCFSIVIVPHGMPKTKPKACNYGLAHAKGEYVVIYDAEDVPDPQQLKKAYLAFQKEENKNIVCMQAKLNFYNPNQNILTRVFTAEYSLWFGLVLTGLQSIKAPIPLGGTSNHFKTSDLHLLNGWDPFNVTEDCDLGMRLCKMGYQTAILDSTTMEEANSDFMNWMKQRSRWIKGYMQTYLVHMRDPREFISGWKNPDVITFQLVVGLKVVSLFINPFMWLITIAYFSFRPIIGPTIDSLFPPVIFYMAIICLVFGNFLYLYYYMIGCYKRKQWDIVAYVFFVPIYWLMMSIAAWIALYQIIFKPHYWEKTVHGLHLSKINEP